jgi:hypothetical protein
MSGTQLMVVLIVAIVMVASIIKAKVGGGRHARELSEGSPEERRISRREEVQRVQEEMRALRERVAVLERIATDRNHLLEQEIEQLRDR